MRHLRYFIAVAEAEQLHVSQSPLSRQIAQLEQEIGAQLFVPWGRGVKLSPAGRSFLEGARATMARAALAVEDARATRVADESDPLVRSLLEITVSVHAS